MANNKEKKNFIEKMANEEDKNKALEGALKQIEKNFGKGAIMKLGDDSDRTNIQAISTGTISLDLATGIGGIPQGRITEIFGPESSGKTTLTLHIIAEAQKKGGKAAFIDAEHALDPIYAKNLGVDIDELLVSQPDTGEQALEICDMLVRSSAIDIVVIDSVAALVPKAEIEGEMGDVTVALQARMMSQALRKLAGIVHRSNTAVVFINQLRENVGNMYGPTETTTGGRALKFYASMRIDVRKRDPIKEGDKWLGNKTRFKVVKNKLAPPFRQTEVDIIFGEGISKEGDIIDSALELNIIDKAGSWYSFEGTRIGQGKEKAKLYLKEHPEMFAKVEELLYKSLEEPDATISEDTDTDVETENTKQEKHEPIIDEDGVILD